MEEAFEEIAHLASSENRVRVLEALDGGSATRRELQDRLAISQSTASRILGEFEDREWVVRSDGRFEATSLGSLVVRAFLRLLRTMKAKEDLRDLLSSLPVLEGELELTDFEDARVTFPSPQDPFRTARPVAERSTTADRVVGLTNTVAPESIGASRRAVTDRGQRFEIVLDRELLETIRADSALSEDLAAIVAADTATVYEHPSVPYAMGVLDEVAQLALADGQGAVLALVETEDERVREWVRSTFEAYREEARELIPSDLEVG